MANEITVQSSISVRNAGFIFPKQGETKQITQSVLGGGLPGYVKVATTAGGEVITVTDVASLGWMYIKNLDAVNFVTYGPTSGGAMIPFGKLKPLESAIIRLVPGIVLRVLADTAECKILCNIFED